MSKKLKNTDGFRLVSDESPLSYNDAKDVIDELRRDEEQRRKKEKLFAKKSKKRKDPGMGLTYTDNVKPIPLMPLTERRFDLIERSQNMAKRQFNEALSEYNSEKFSSRLRKTAKDVKRELGSYGEDD